MHDKQRKEGESQKAHAKGKPPHKPAQRSSPKTHINKRRTSVPFFITL